jgi:putative protein-disulfide isomerase
MNSSTRFLYVHDPMCSWCWAHRKEWDKLEAKLAGLVTVQHIVGGLAPDSDDPMPQEQRKAISGYWQKIHDMLGVEFNFDFWTNNTPRRSTYPACRAVIAARWQNAEKEMILALQQAYYLRALNPSDADTHLQLAKELELDVAQFEQDLTSEKLQNVFETELKYAHSLPIQGFPSMVLIQEQKAYSVPLDYKDHTGAFDFVKEVMGVH